MADRRGIAAPWGTLTLLEQMAHIGSEVERSIRAHESGRKERLEKALDRALELFDLTATDERWRGPRRREILRAREEVCRLFFDDDVWTGSCRGLRDYFLSFAVAARQPGAFRDRP